MFPRHSSRYFPRTFPLDVSRTFLKHFPLEVPPDSFPRYLPSHPLDVPLGIAPGCSLDIFSQMSPRHSPIILPLDNSPKRSPDIPPGCSPLTFLPGHCHIHFLRRSAWTCPDISPDVPRHFLGHPLDIFLAHLTRHFPMASPRIFSLDIPPWIFPRTFPWLRLLKYNILANNINLMQSINQSIYIAP